MHRALFCLWWGLAVGFGQREAPAATPAEWARQHVDELVALYREFHSQPELSLQEEQTAARLAAAWKAAGYEVTTGVGGHGVVALLRNGPGPRLMLRTDLDALPVTEKTELVYASQVRVKNKDGVEVGVMHACGHDVHITNLVGVARYLAAHRQQWSGTLLLIGQPAEELGEGAQRMLNDKLYERFGKPDFALALHVDATLPTGQVGYRAGYALANVDSVDVTLLGKGGHGASPHTTIDPIVMAARLVLDLQTLVSRETNPVEPAVVTVGSIHAGSKHNVISDRCHLQITVRSYSEKVRQRLLDGIRRKAQAVAQGAGAAEPIVQLAEAFTPALYNDDQLVARLVPVFERVLGKENVVRSEPAMGGEDFSRYAEAGVPIAMFRLGSVEPRRLAGLKRGGQEPPSLHSAIYYPDADLALATGVSALASAALELLAPRPASPP
jgi:hippurate hydrolase